MQFFLAAIRSPSLVTWYRDHAELSRHCRHTADRTIKTSQGHLQPLALVCAYVRLVPRCRVSSGIALTQTAGSGICPARRPVA
jgi:hypothetical protein